MPKGNHIGEFQQLVLMALLHLGEDAYGMRVRRDIEERALRPVSIGAVYATLDRLEEKGFVTSRRGEPTPERGGRAKRHFRITGAGVAALEEAQAVQQRMRSFLPARPATT